MEQRYSALIYPHSFGTRPNKKEMDNKIKLIVSKLMDHHMQVTLQELHDYLISGHVVLPCYLDRLMNVDAKGAGNQHFIRSSLIFIDIDYSERQKKNLSKKEIEAIWTKAGIPPAFGYETSSSTASEPRYRLVFALTEPIEDAVLYKNACQRLSQLFDGDPRACNASHVFYPGHSSFAQGFCKVKIEKILNLKDFSDVPKEKMERSRKELSRVAGKVVPLTAEMKAIKQLDSRFFREKFRGSPVDNLYERWNNYIRSMSTKSGTIIFNNNTKDYCTYFRATLSNKVVATDPRLYYAISAMVPLDLFLGLPFMENIRCIYPHHEDERSSARIELDKNSGYIYHCYGCPNKASGSGAMDDIFNLIETIAGCTHRRAKQFLAEIFGLYFETDWMRQEKENLFAMMNYIESKDFELDFPKLRSHLVRSNSLGLLSFMIREASRHIFDERYKTKENQPIFFSSLRHISITMRALGYRGAAKSNIQTKLKFLQNLELIKCLPDQEIPSAMLSISWENQKKNQERYRVSYYSMTPFAMASFAKAEDLCQYEYEEKGVKRKYYSQETEIRSNGKERAATIYVQAKEIELDNRFYEKTLAAAKILLAKQKYLTEGDLLNSIRGYTRKEKEKELAYCLPQLIQELKLERKNFNKKIAITLNIVPKKGLYYGVSKILLPKGDRNA